MEILKFIIGNLIGFFILYQGDRGLWYQVCLLKSIPYGDELVAEDIFKNQDNTFINYYKIIPLFGVMVFANIAIFFEDFVPVIYSSTLAGIWLVFFVAACLMQALRSFNIYVSNVSGKAG